MDLPASQIEATNFWAQKFHQDFSPIDQFIRPRRRSTEGLQAVPGIAAHQPERPKGWSCSGWVPRTPRGPMHHDASSYAAGVTRGTTLSRIRLKAIPQDRA